MAQRLYGSGSVWGTIFLVPVFCLARDYIWAAFQETFRPTDVDAVRRRERYGAVAPLDEETGLDALMPPSVAAPGAAGPATHKGFAFSANENTASVTQAEVIRRYDTTTDKPEG